MEYKNLTKWLMECMLVLLLFVASLPKSVAGDYRGMMAEYLRLDKSDAFTAKDLDPSFSVMAMDKGYSLVETKAILRDFSESYLKNLTLDWLEGIFREFVTDEDWTVCSETFSTPEGMLAKKQMDDMSGDELSVRLRKKLTPVLLSIMAGQKIGKPKLDIPKDYQKAFHVYWKTQFEGMASAQAILRSFASDGDSRVQKAFFSYLVDNMEVLVMECCYPDFQKESLLLCSNFYATKSGAHFLAASNAMLLKFDVLDDVVNQKYREFLEERFVSDPPKDLFLKPLEDAVEGDDKG